MMKKFEEYLNERINELKDKQEKFIEIKNNPGRATHFREKCLNLSIKYGEIVTELEKTLNHFRQSAEAQSVADNESQRERLIAFFREQTKLNYVSIYENDFEFAEKALKAINCD